MKVIVRSAKIIDPKSAFHLKRVDLLIHNGKVEAIEKKLPEETKNEISGKNLVLLPGLCDLRAFSREPGYESMETLESLAKSAAAGGFTQVAVMPNTKPVINHKSDLNYIQRFSQSSLSQLLPTAAVTKDALGIDFNEMWDLHAHGAAAFTDGSNTIWNADILLKSLQYLAPLKALLIQKAQEPTLAMHGQMHEGLVSTQLGLKGIPSAAETVLIQRDLTLLEYADIQSNQPILHFTCVSTAEGVQMIKRAKKAGLPISCDVSVNHLIFTEENLATYDTQFKCSPPLRNKKDQKALIKGLQEGTIDAIVSDHQAWDEEHKKCEFDQAGEGTLGLQTLLPALLSKTELSLELLAEKLSITPRLLLQQARKGIQTQEPADLCIIDLAGHTYLNEKTNLSESQNTPFWKEKLKGKIIATFANGYSELYK